MFADDAGTMAAGKTVTFHYDRSIAASAGESLVTFTENLTFDTRDTAGSTYYLTDTASTSTLVAPSRRSRHRRAGGGAVNAVTNTAAGPTAGIQITDSAGGTAIEWYTPALEAATLGGRAQIQHPRLESNAAANARQSRGRNRHR